MHKRVTTENESNSWTELGTQKARIQRRRNRNIRLWLLKRTSSQVKSYVHAADAGS